MDEQRSDKVENEAAQNDGDPSCAFESDSYGYSIQNGDDNYHANAISECSVFIIRH